MEEWAQAYIPAMNVCKLQAGKGVVSSADDANTNFQDGRGGGERTERPKKSTSSRIIAEQKAVEDQPSTCFARLDRFFQPVYGTERGYLHHAAREM